MKCPICDNNKENKSYMIKEMLQGFREEFEYVECSNCGCLFIKEIPENIDKYYDINYAPHVDKTTPIDKITEKIYAMYLANNKIIKFIQRDNVTITSKFWNSLSSNGIINKNSSILDVGCGNGHFLSLLKKGGFKDLTGVDLFIDEKNMPNDIKIFQSSLEDFNLRRKYDLITSNHSFEHMDNQLKNLKCLEGLLNDNGTLIIRIPVKTNTIWKKYGVNWFQIDAPRHFFLHTVDSFKILCNKTNLLIKDIIFDSDERSLVNSEKYMQNISARDDEWDTYQVNNETLLQLKKEVKKLNMINEADQAIFVLKLK